MQRYHTVLFDADNTLFDFDRAEHEALGRALRERGYPDDDATRETYLAINRELWRRFDLGEADQDWLLVERFRRFEAAMGGHHDPERFNRDYLTYLGEGAFLLPGAMELCRTLSERCTLAIVTNGATIAQTGRFARSGLAPYFKGLFISQELGCRKPERAYFDTVLSRLGAPAWTPSGTTPAGAGRRGTSFPPIPRKITARWPPSSWGSRPEPSDRQRFDIMRCQCSCTNRPTTGPGPTARSASPSPWCSPSWRPSSWPWPSP